MFRFEVKHALAAMVEFAFPQWDANQGLYVKVDVDMYHPNDVDVSQRMMVHFLFMAQSNYKRVFYCETEFARIGQPKPTEWHDLSHHDSAWRDDGFREFDSLYFRMAKRVSQEIAPKDLKHLVWINEARYVDVKLTERPAEHQTSGRTQYYPNITWRQRKQVQEIQT